MTALAIICLLKKIMMDLFRFHLSEKPDGKPDLLFLSDTVPFTD